MSNFKVGNELNGALTKYNSVDQNIIDLDSFVPKADYTTLKNQVH